MYMPLVAAEDGVVQFVKQPGVSLEPGDILGILTLEDPLELNTPSHSMAFFLLWATQALLATRLTNAISAASAH